MALVVVVVRNKTETLDTTTTCTTVREGGGDGEQEQQRVFDDDVEAETTADEWRDDGDDAGVGRDKPETTRRVAFGGENDALQSRKYKPFAGKASNAFAFEVPADWVVAIDRPVEEKQRRRKAETKVVVGQFKTIDTMSVRLEIADDSVKKAFELAEKEKDGEHTSRESLRKKKEKRRLGKSRKM